MGGLSLLLLVFAAFAITIGSRRTGFSLATLALVNLLATHLPLGTAIGWSLGLIVVWPFLQALYRGARWVLAGEQRRRQLREGQRRSRRERVLVPAKSQHQDRATQPIEEGAPWLS